jgi:hypothetical protein
MALAMRELRARLHPKTSLQRPGPCIVPVQKREDNEGKLTLRRRPTFTSRSILNCA